MKKLLYTLLFFPGITSNLVFAQVKEKTHYHFDKAKNDTIKFTEVNENLELITDDPSNVVKGYDVKIAIKKQFVILPIKGTNLGTQLMSYLKEIKPHPKMLEIENIVSDEKGVEKKYKGFVLYFK